MSDNDKAVQMIVPSLYTLKGVSHPAGSRGWCGLEDLHKITGYTPSELIERFAPMAEEAYDGMFLFATKEVKVLLKIVSAIQEFLLLERRADYATRLKNYFVPSAWGLEIAEIYRYIDRVEHQTLCVAPKEMPKMITSRSDPKVLALSKILGGRLLDYRPVDYALVPGPRYWRKNSYVFQVGRFSSNDAEQT